MFSALVRVNEGLLSSSRLPALSRVGGQVSVLEVLALLLIGACAAAAALAPDFHLRIPGHAILRSVFPMALGLALVPRRSGGTLMAASALATVLLARLFGASALGFGALTSLCLTGPFLDLALLKARGGWQLYLGFVLAGLGSNLAAFLVRGGAKMLALDLGGRALGVWYQPALLTHPVCGILAGLISAAVWFQLRNRLPQGAAPEDRP